MSIEIYHNPRCSKSRQTLQLLQEQGVEPEIVEYLKTPPDRKTLEEILDMLGLEPRDLMRKKEAEYKSEGLDNPKLTRKQLIDAMHRAPQADRAPDRHQRRQGGHRPATRKGAGTALSHDSQVR